jgi:hypothetical protein
MSSEMWMERRKKSLLAARATEQRTREVADPLAAFEAIPMPGELWSRARRAQLALATMAITAAFRPQTSSSPARLRRPAWS